MKLTLNLELPSGEVQPVQLPADVSMDRLVPALVRKLGLPLVDGSGQSLHYDLLPPGGSPLASVQILADIGLGPAARLRLRAQPLTWESSAQATQAPTPDRSAAPPRPAQPINPLDAHLHQPARRPAVVYESAEESDQASSGARNALGFVLFLIYLGIRLIGFVFDSGSDTAQQVSPPVVTPRATAVPNMAIEALPALNRFANIPVDSPVLIGEKLYYLYADEAGYALWRQDLTRLDGPPVRLLQVSESRGNGRALTVRDGSLYFPMGQDEALWRLGSDGRSAQPLRIGGRLVYELPLVLGGRQVFRGSSGNVFLPLYAARTVTHSLPVSATISPTLPAGSHVITTTEVITLPILVTADWLADQAVLADVSYFSGRDDLSGNELWRTDGTVSGTYRVMDINPGLSGSTPRSLSVSSGYLYFSAINEGVQRELWRSDGTADGTVQITDLRGTQGAYPADLFVLDGELIFTALTSPTRRSLLHLQGTDEAPQLTPLDYDINADWVEDQLVPFAGKLAFLVNEPDRTTLMLYDQAVAHSRRLWLTGQRFVTLQAVGSNLLVRAASGDWYRLADGSAFLQRLGRRMGDVVAVVPEPAGTSLLVDQQAYLWRLDADGELQFLANLAGTN